MAEFLRSRSLSSSSSSSFFSATRVGVVAGAGDAEAVAACRSSFRPEGSAAGAAGGEAADSVDSVVAAVEAGSADSVEAAGLEAEAVARAGDDGSVD
jgi:GTPase involved in cell partitioning and DNA repair